MDSVLEEALQGLLRITTTSTTGTEAIQRVRTTLADLQLIDPTSLAALAQHLSAHGTSVAEELAALAAAGTLLADAYPDHGDMISLALSSLASSSPSSPLDKFRKALGVAFKMMVEGGGTASILQDAMDRLRPSVSEDSAKMTASAVRWAVGLPKGKTLRPKDLAPLAAALVEQRLDYLLSRAKPARDKLIGRDALEKAIQEVRSLELRTGGGIQSVAALEARRTLEQQQHEAAHEALAASAAAEQDDLAASSGDADSEGDGAAVAGTAMAGPVPLGHHDETVSAVSGSARAGGTLAGADEAEQATAPSSLQSGQALPSAGSHADDGLTREETSDAEVEEDENEEGEEGEERAAEGPRPGRRASSPLTPLVSDDDNDDGSDSDAHAADLDAASARGSSERGTSPILRGRPTYTFGDSDSDDAHNARRRKRRRRTVQEEPTEYVDDDPVFDDQDNTDLEDSPASPPPAVLEYDLVARTTRLSVSPGPPSFKEPPAEVDLDASPRDFMHLLTHPSGSEMLDASADADVDVLPFSLQTETTAKREDGRLSDEERADLRLDSRATTLAAFRALSPHEREQAVLSMEERYAQLLKNLAAKLGASMSAAAYWHTEANLFQKRSLTKPLSSTSPKISARADKLSRQVLNGDSARSPDEDAPGSEDEDDGWAVADEDDDELAALNKAAMDEAIREILAGAHELSGLS